MRSIWTIAIVLLASAASERADAGARFGMDGYGGWNRFAMGAINDSLASFNEEFGTALESIHEGDSWGLGLHLWPQPNVRLRLGFENLEARSEDSGVGFDFGLQAYTLGATWFTSPDKPIRFGAGAALGPHFAHGGFHAPGASLTSSGNGFGGQVDGEVLVPVWRGWSVSGVIGYRWAGIGGIKLGESSTHLQPSYDGWLMRIGMAYDSPH